MLSYLETLLIYKRHSSYSCGIMKMLSSFLRFPWKIAQGFQKSAHIKHLSISSLTPRGSVVTIKIKAQSLSFKHLFSFLFCLFSFPYCVCELNWGNLEMCLPKTSFRTNAASTVCVVRHGDLNSYNLFQSTFVCSMRDPCARNKNIL